MIIGHTAEIYVGGTNIWIQSIIAFTLTLLIATFVFVPWYHPLKLTSIYRVSITQFCKYYTFCGSDLEAVWKYERKVTFIQIRTTSPFQLA